MSNITTNRQFKYLSKPQKKFLDGSRNSVIPVELSRLYVEKQYQVENRAGAPLEAEAPLHFRCRASISSHAALNRMFFLATNFHAIPANEPLRNVGAAPSERAAYHTISGRQP